MDKGNYRIRAATTSDLESVLKIAKLASTSTERDPLLTLRIESGECLVSASVKSSHFPFAALAPLQAALHLDRKSVV